MLSISSRPLGDQAGSQQSAENLPGVHVLTHSGSGDCRFTIFNYFKALHKGEG